MEVRRYIWWKLILPSHWVREAVSMVKKKKKILGIRVFIQLKKVSWHFLVDNRVPDIVEVQCHLGP